MENIKRIFFDNTLRRWHFGAIVRESGMSRERVNYYLKMLLKDNLIKRAKPRGKMPYYAANRDSGRFRTEKRFYGLNLLQKSGLFEHINSLEKVRTAILFGSFSRGDFNKSSDIDLFIYGDIRGFEKGRFESKLKREIQVFSYKSPKEVEKGLDAKVIPNIFKGFNIKESLEPFKVDLNA